MLVTGSPGSYQSLSGQAVCNATPPGHFSSIGASTPNPCAAGSTAAVEGATLCTPCTAGKYQSSRGATACTVCPERSWCAEGSAQPVVCGRGFYGSVAGLEGEADCVTCPLGSWCSGGARIACPPNTYSEIVRADSQAACITCPARSGHDLFARSNAAACGLSTGVQTRSHGSSSGSIGISVECR